MAKKKFTTWDSTVSLINPSCNALASGSIPAVVSASMLELSCFEILVILKSEGENQGGPIDAYNTAQ